MCDIQKCFDSIFHEILVFALEQFNFGPKMIAITKEMLRARNFCLNLNGTISDNKINADIGLGEGLAASGDYFEIVYESLAIQIRMINIPTFYNPVTYHVDDLMLLNEEEKILSQNHLPF